MYTYSFSNRPSPSTSSPKAFLQETYKVEDVLSPLSAFFHFKIPFTKKTCSIIISIT